MRSGYLSARSEDSAERTVLLMSCLAFESYQAHYGAGVTADRVIECLLLDRALPRSARFSASTALDAVTRIEGKSRRSRPMKLLARLNGMYLAANTESIAEHPLDFDPECRSLL